MSPTILLNRAWTTGLRSSLIGMARGNCTPRPIFQLIHRTYADLPAHTPVLLPALSPTMEFGTIISWEKKEGDKLSEGDLLAEIETDKATMGLETPEEGFLAKIVVAAGTKDVPIGKLVCVIVENSADIGAFANYEGGGASAPAKAPAAPAKSPAKSPSSPAAGSSPAPSPAPAKVSTQSQAAAGAGSSTARPFASPLARALAASRGIDLSTIPGGSGFASSITSADLGKAGPGAGTSPAAGGSVSGAPGIPLLDNAFTDVTVSGMRNVIAKRLMQSKQTIPHYYLTTEIPMDLVLQLRAQFNKEIEKSGVKISVNDFIIKAAAGACVKVPEVNSSWMETVIRQYSSVDVSVAVSTDKGLITPIVFGANKKGLIEIAGNVKELAKKARDGKLQPKEFQGGTFSVSNLGMYGIHHFSAIINPPQAAILAIGATSVKMVPNVGREGFTPSTVMYATLSCDHRVVDGAVAAQWLQAFKSYLSQPAAILL